MKQKTGSEEFILNGKSQDFKLIDFWRWQSSDLLDNTLRGVLAEFIVAKALGVDTESTGFGWGGYDVLFTDGDKKCKIEVKSSAYAQSWNKEANSELSFRISKQAVFLSEKKRYGDEYKRKSEIYIFCILKEKDKENANPLLLEQWDFYPVLTSDIDEKLGNQKTAKIRTVQRLCPNGPYSFTTLREAVLLLSKQINPANTNSLTDNKTNMSKSSL